MIWQSLGESWNRRMLHVYFPDLQVGVTWDAQSEGDYLVDSSCSVVLGQREVVWEKEPQK